MLLTRKRGKRIQKSRIDQVMEQRRDTAQMSRNRQETLDRIAGYELKYGMRSDQVHGAIDRGQLKETQEVCSWLIAYDSMERSKRR